MSDAAWQGGREQAQLSGERTRLARWLRHLAATAFSGSSIKHLMGASEVYDGEGAIGSTQGACAFSELRRQTVFYRPPNPVK